MRRYRMGAWLLMSITCASAAHAGTEQGAVSASVQFARIIQGFSDPINVQIYNQALAGSDPFNYSVYATSPGGNSASQFGIRAADGGVGFDSKQFLYDSTNAAFGLNQLSVTVTNTSVPTQMLQQFGSVQVLRRPIMGFAVAGGGEVPLSSTPIAPVAQEPSVDPLAFGATGGGSSFAAGAPRVIGDPPPLIPTANIDLDSIVPSGDSQITITLPTFFNLPPSDPTDSPDWMIQVDTTTPGLFNAGFQLNYSDEDGIGGGTLAGEEHGYFSVVARVTPAGGGQVDVKVWVLVPEPSSALICLGSGVLLAGRRSRSKWKRTGS